MRVAVPVLGTGLNVVAELLPVFEAVPLEGNRAQDLPPRFNQVEIRRSRGKKEELPARMGQGEKHYLASVVAVEVVYDGHYALVSVRQPGIYLLQEGHPRGNCAPVIGLGKSLSRGGDKGAEDVASPSAAIVGFVFRALMRWDQSPTRKGGRDQGAHLVETDYDASFGALPV